MDSGFFKILCQNKDFKSSNLNQLFESYGCNTLEAKVPVVRKETLEEIRDCSDNTERLHRQLSLQATSSRNAVEGRPTRTRNKTLRLVEVNGTTVLETGETRDRSPVELVVLEEDLENYVRERDRLASEHTKSEPDTGSFSSSSDKLNRQADTGPAKVDEQAGRLSCMKLHEAKALDDELSSYMKETNRLKAQKKQLEGVSMDRIDEMERMEQLSDDDISFDLGEDPI